MVFVFLIVAVLASAAVWAIIRSERRERRSAKRLPPLVYPFTPAYTVEPEAPLPDVDPILVAAEVAPAATPSRPFVPPPEIELPIAAAAEPEATVRFRRPTEDAVQLLPGRLEVLAGEPHHKEIRFVRRPGERPEVILGREYGDNPAHVALQSTTVSRRHARLAYANGQWKVANLSQTNPVVVNDEALSAGNGERTLADGDCLELGEVVLRFHAS